MKMSSVLHFLPASIFRCQLEAGQYCTFIIHSDGTVSGCGKGTYGRLGLGDSSNHPTPKTLAFDARFAVKKISSSKGSDGHTLALTVDGQVFSWGDGRLTLALHIHL